METKQFTQFFVQKLVFIITIVFFSCQAFCADPNSASTAKKLQIPKQPDKKTAAVKKTKPAPTANPSSFRPDMPLREAIDILRYSTVPPLNIVVLWKDLDENADITRDTPIGMDGLFGVPLKTHLNILLTSLSAGSTSQLGYVVDGNVIIIATKESLPKKLITRTYNIADIVAPPSMGGIGMGMGMGMNGMSYGNMMPYGMNGTLGGLNSYNNSGSVNQGYMNQGYPNQNYNNMNNQRGIGMPVGF